jgi:hypothetical protein
MPITAFQKEVLGLLASQRSEASHVGGGIAINRDDASPRYSDDVDIFHDIADAVATTALADEAILKAAGCEVTWQLCQPNLYRAHIRRVADEVRLDWCFDSAFRFFPIEPDPEMGFVLHRADLATNKLLALAGRSEIRDYIDILHLHQTELSLGAITWAACGKDAGFTPDSLLAMAKRHVRFRQDDLDREHLRVPLNLCDLKHIWNDAVDRAEAVFLQLSSAEVGCLYLTVDGKPTTPDPASAEFPKLRRHYGSVHGAWPTLANP